MATTANERTTNSQSTGPPRSKMAPIKSITITSYDGGVSTVLQAHRDACDALLTRALGERSCEPELAAAIEYAVLAPGKRLRPALVRLANQCIGGELQDAEAPAAAVEMIHAFSLVHDDLPALDNDDLRRGRPTLHRHADEATAILAGDAMPMLAMRLLAHTPNGPAMCSVLAEATLRMIEGQMMDMAAEREALAIDEQNLRALQAGKTGALLVAAVELGALSAKASTPQIEALTAWANHLGQLFQLTDDLLDATASSETMGKRTGKDEGKSKLTGVRVYGLAGLRDRIQTCRQDALDALQMFGPEAADLRLLTQEMVDRSH